MQLSKQILEEIARQISSKSFHKTALYKLLRDELLSIGNWKAKPRGKPDVKNFKNVAHNNRTLDASGIQYYD